MQDPRGNLTLTYLGLADKLKPKWIVYENVPGLLSSNGGKDFGSFLGALVELGYGFAYRVLDAQHFGVPQRRRRVFVVACLGDWRAAAEVLSLCEGLRGYLETGNKKRKSPAADASGGVGTSRKLFDMQAIGQYGADGVASTCKMRDYKDATDLVVKPIVIDRAAFNQGENAQYVPHIGESEVMDSLVARGPHAVGIPICSDVAGTLTVGHHSCAGHQHRMGDHSFLVGQPLPFRKSKRACSTTDNETWVPADASNTLNNFDLGDTRTTHAVVQPHIVQASELRLRGQITEQNTCPTLLANTKSGDNDPLAVQAITFQPGNLRRDAGADPSTTTTTTTLKASAGDQTPHVATAMAVRRLTPVECERLQGFPDNWSRISWKGKPEDQCPDGPRYKACGNSMAVPVMRWIGERIAAVDATL